MKAERRVGTVSRGIRCPIFREGDSLPEGHGNGRKEGCCNAQLSVR